MILYSSDAVVISFTTNNIVKAAQVNKEHIPMTLVITESKVYEGPSLLSKKEKPIIMYYIHLNELKFAFVDYHLAVGYFKMFCTDFEDKKERDYPELFL